MRIQVYVLKEATAKIMRKKLHWKAQQGKNGTSSSETKKTKCKKVPDTSYLEDVFYNIRLLIYSSNKLNIRLNTRFSRVGFYKHFTNLSLRSYEYKYST